MPKLTIEARMDFISSEFIRLDAIKLGEVITKKGLSENAYHK
jgi:hypothetical protein